MDYSIQAPGPHGPGYRLAGLPVSCRQLEADAGTIHRRHKFHGGGKFFTGRKHLGHRRGEVTTVATAPQPYRSFSGDRETNKHTNRWTSLSHISPLLRRGLN